MSKKIVFMIAFIVLSISNNTQTMLTTLMLSLCFDDGENCCANCCTSTCDMISAVVALFAEEKSQAKDCEYNAPANSDYLTQSHFSMSKSQKELESNKIK